MQTLPRLVFLASQLKEKTPNIPRDLLRYLPQAELIQAVSQGLETAALQLGISSEQLKNIARHGDSDWPGEEATPQEFRLAVAHSIMDGELIDTLSLDKRLKVMSQLERFVSVSTQAMFIGESIPLWEITEPIEIPKWESGFAPLDLVTEGLYQALLVVMGAPGTGKTSTMLTLAETLKRRDPTIRILFNEIEIPGPLLQARMMPIFERGNPFTPGDFIHTGALSVEDIMEKAAESAETHGDHNQVVFIDSPDSMSDPESGERRFEIEHIYRMAVRIKTISRLVVLASQPKQKDTILTLRSGAESWAKAWYPDIIIGLQTVGGGKIRMKNLKNRFGPPALEATYHYDLASLRVSQAMLEEDGEW